MKISGFSFIRNATKLYYPVKQSIMSTLDLVDEFIIAVGAGDPDDDTRKEIESIGSDKIKIIDTVWNLDEYPGGTEYAHQTDIAREQCVGDWLLYLQSDEVLHENALDEIRLSCEKYLDDKRVEGFLFRYYHFWGDYEHYHRSHAWYPAEIRIIRNDLEIHSWNDAQSFRRMPGFDTKDYKRKEGTSKLKVVELHARIFHYGWVRPPDFMQSKRKEFARAYRGNESAEKEHKNTKQYFDYGPLSKLKEFGETHPAVMKVWIDKFNWQDKLQYTGSISNDRRLYKHEKFKYRFLSFIENYFLGGKTIGGFRNYIRIRP